MSVSINNSTPSFFVAEDPISDPILEPINPPTTEAISDSTSESVAFFPTTPPIARPAAAPTSLSPSIVTLVTSEIVPKTTYCSFCASDLLTTSGEKPGYAKKAITPVLGSIVGKAMENKDTVEESVILISVGRL